MGSDSAPAASPAREAGATIVDHSAVVVGVDSSDGSRAAVEWAAAEAVSLGVPLRIVHAWTLPDFAPWTTRLDRDIAVGMRAENAVLLTRYAALAQGTPGLEVSADSAAGYADQVLTTISADAPLVVVGTHHLGSVGRAVLGSVSSAIGSKAKCPVVVVPGHRDPRASGQPVVIGVAPHSQQDARLVDFGLDYARRHHAAVRVVTCWDPPLGDRTLPPPHELHVWLSELVSGCRDRYPDVDRVQLIVKRAQPREELLSETGAAMLLVLGRRHGRTHLGGFLGSIGVAAVRNATCPVAIVPPDPAVLDPMV